jgi:HEAT repeat protein
MHRAYDNRKAKDSVAGEWAHLKAMRKDGDVNGLLAALNDPREASFEAGGETYYHTVRSSAARELGKLGDPRAVVPIATLLNDPRFTVRGSAAMALGELGDPAATPDLIKALEDEHPNVRGRAAQSLGRIGDRSATKKLEAGLRDSNAWARVMVAKALARIGNRDAIGPLKEAVHRESFRHPTVRLRLSKSLLSLRLSRLKMKSAP